TEATDCPCGEPLQTRAHIIQECPLYEEDREVLRSFDRDLSLQRLLGEPEGIEALAEFIRRSDAFTKTPDRETHPGGSTS
ncbi:hypothetical protein SISSUDRAFT_983617, partial [Sistotremastrum suecicum HHB10207 ss-3]